MSCCNYADVAQTDTMVSRFRRLYKNFDGIMGLLFLATKLENNIKCFSVASVACNNCLHKCMHSKTVFIWVISHAVAWIDWYIGLWGKGDPSCVHLSHNFKHWAWRNFIFEVPLKKSIHTNLDETSRHTHLKYVHDQTWSAYHWFVTCTHVHNHPYSFIILRFFLVGSGCNLL